MSSPLLDMNGQVKISFGPGKMQAFIEVTAPVGSGLPCKREDIFKALKEHEISYGIDEAVIDKVLEPQNWNKNSSLLKGKSR